MKKKKKMVASSKFCQICSSSPEDSDFRIKSVCHQIVLNHKKKGFECESIEDFGSFGKESDSKKVFSINFSTLFLE